MALNFLSPAEIKAISFVDSTKSNLLPKLQEFSVQFRIRISHLQLGQEEPGRKTWDGPKPISIVGSTGSIGTQTLDIVVENPDKFKVVALAAGSNVTLLADQVISLKLQENELYCGLIVRTFKPQLVAAVRNESLVDELKKALADVEEKPEIIPGEQGVVEVARHPDAVSVVTGIVGCAGLKPTVAAIEAGKDICLANKETLTAGVLLFSLLLTNITDWPVEKLKEVKVADALKHPNWNMGKKITVDSATLFSKGLEVIEAPYLFGAEYDNIDIVIHPDSTVLAQMGRPDMRLPILYTMSWPERVYCSEITWPRLDLCKLGSLTFKAPDNVKYPSVNLCYAAGRAGGTMTGVLSAANEKAVEMFVEEKISYLDIFKVVELTSDKHQAELVASPSLEEIIHYDLWAREYAASLQQSVF
ncbi:hypothetical protein DKX38_018681 [Salix brachista]|uniref:1-deoxy-D-xylulose-5-phosphate reductoisomerase n=1 Tax=Salix brachista TaxID=2182728 RepID=A0A5N5KNU4_9ROSI|nr:hypothetical protein DKX38_018681 [Salix brachista]